MASGRFNHGLGGRRLWVPTSYFKTVRNPKQAVAFYSVLAFSVGLGVILNFAPVDPIKALYWRAVTNGVLAAPVMVMLMLLVRNPIVIGDLVIRRWLYALGWASTIAWPSVS
jgi:Mn2+/Fe2+ NRAMP family transporter